MNLIMHGPPGSGKGTQAKLLAENLGLRHISSGQLLREEVAKDSPKAKIIAKFQAKGELVPFETLLDILEPVILDSHSGFILDGTPRDLRQAEHLDWFLVQHKLKLSKFIFLSIPDTVSIDRLLKRAQVEHRPDDTYDTIKHRFEVYHHETEPVIRYYRQQGLVLEIDGTPTVEAIQADIINRLTIA